MPALSIRLVCAGCGYLVPQDEPRPFRCPRAARADDEVDHVLARRLDAAAFSGRETREIFQSEEPQPFLRYRRLLYGFQASRAAGMEEQEWVGLVERLDRAVESVEGRGVRVTPFARQAELARAVGMDAVWVKDETGNVGGSHKGRHLMGLAIWLEAARSWSGRKARDAELAPLVIASCGNAALAAAVVARAAERPIEVFIPPYADRPVIDELRRLEARLTACPRRAGEAGDPCYLRFREAVDAGAVPFSCQGNENGLAIEGGMTLAWEIASALRGDRRRIDHLLIQVGGGALATACIQALREARSLGVLGELPRIHAVQTEAVHPLYRAYRRLAAELLGEERPPAARDDSATAPADDERARRILAEVPRASVGAALRRAAGHRSSFMWPWEHEARSLANAILDDEAYDWLSVVEGMLGTGGIPLLVSEGLLAEANELAHETTGLPVGATGSAGLAGLLRLRRLGIVAPDETALLLFTGVTRFR